MVVPNERWIHTFTKHGGIPILALASSPMHVVKRNTLPIWNEHSVQSLSENGRWRPTIVPCGSMASMTICRVSHVCRANTPRVPNRTWGPNNPVHPSIHPKPCKDRMAQYVFILEMPFVLHLSATHLKTLTTVPGSQGMSGPIFGLCPGSRDWIKERDNPLTGKDWIKVCSTLFFCLCGGAVPSLFAHASSSSPMSNSHPLNGTIPVPCFVS